METFNQVKETVYKAAKDAKDMVVDVAHEAQDLVMGVGDRNNNRGPAVGSSDALAVLRADHEVIFGLFEQLRSSDANAQSRQDLFAQLKYELESHTIAEEKQFYPALEKASSGDLREPDLIRRAVAEHQELRRLLGKLAATSLPSQDFNANLDALEQEVRRHVRFEESELFRIARERFTQEQLQGMGDRILKEEQRATERGSRRPAARQRPTTRGTTRRPAAKQRRRTTKRQTKRASR